MRDADAAPRHAGSPSLMSCRNPAFSGAVLAPPDARRAFRLSVHRAPHCQLAQWGDRDTNFDPIATCCREKCRRSCTAYPGRATIHREFWLRPKL